MGQADDFGFPLSGPRPRRASTFSSLVRSFIAPRSSSVRPLKVVSVAVLLLADCRVVFFAGFLSAIAQHLRAPMVMSMAVRLAVVRRPHIRVEHGTLH